jgi:hypothetical protein
MQVHLLVFLQKAGHFAGGSFRKACSVLRIWDTDWNHFMLKAAQDFNANTFALLPIGRNVGSLQSFKIRSNARLTVVFPFSYFYLCICGAGGRIQGLKHAQHLLYH